MASLPVRRRCFTRGLGFSAADGFQRLCPRRWACSMPPPRSAGVLLFRKRGRSTEVLLIKPGGPYWRSKDVGAWMIPKGMVEPGEAPAEAALREFAEETGTILSAVPFPLATVRQSGGKYVQAFAVEGDLDPAKVRSNDFQMEWP